MAPLRHDNHALFCKRVPSRQLVGRFALGQRRPAAGGCWLAAPPLSTAGGVCWKAPPWCGRGGVPLWWPRPVRPSPLVGAAARGCRAGAAARAPQGHTPRTASSGAPTAPPRPVFFSAAQAVGVAGGDPAAGQGPARKKKNSPRPPTTRARPPSQRLFRRGDSARSGGKGGGQGW